MSAGGEVITLMLFVAQEGKCFHCEAEFRGKGEGTRNVMRYLWTRDHILLAKDGHTRRFNTVLACGLCNHNRGAREATADELARASAIFDKVKIVWRAFYGDDSPPWPSKRGTQNAARVQVLASLGATT